MKRRPSGARGWGLGLTMFVIGLAVLSSSTDAAAQAPPPAVDITGADIKTFIDKLPKDRVSDQPIRIADVGGYKVGVYAVLRPKASVQEAVLHETSVTEIYYMLEGAATLVTGGTLVDEKKSDVSPNTKMPTRRASTIQGGVSRRVVAGDVVIIPGRVPHWWSSLDGDIRYLIYRPDPEGLQTAR